LKANLRAAQGQAQAAPRQHCCNAGVALVSDTCCGNVRHPCTLARHQVPANALHALQVCLTTRGCPRRCAASA
jgi:hypothetical protein